MKSRNDRTDYFKVQTDDMESCHLDFLLAHKTKVHEFTGQLEEKVTTTYKKWAFHALCPFTFNKLLFPLDEFYLCSVWLEFMAWFLLEGSHITWHGRDLHPLDADSPTVFCSSSNPALSVSSYPHMAIWMSVWVLHLNLNGNDYKWPLSCVFSSHTVLTWSTEF